MAWSKKGTRAEPIQPATRAKTTTILGAISARGIINAKMGVPYVASKKRKSASGSNTTPRNLYDEFKGYYIIMDNAPIHTTDSIERLIVSCGYGCIYLPSYSLELNPIEQPWSVAKSKLKRAKLLETKTLNTRITEACNQIYFSDLEGFYRYSASKFETCLNKEPL
ncbi:hypothetical protein G6F37_011565 [Rhizopus arrhizus]|nr:hypothetical protein G6F38_011653 [Rhizopus arrhizus]KAG1148656.1 hypothetical protein G6F37_011565 [Rhizopus arrhizus]